MASAILKSMRLDGSKIDFHRLMRRDGSELAPAGAVRNSKGAEPERHGAAFYPTALDEPRTRRSTHSATPCCHAGSRSPNVRSSLAQSSCELARRAAGVG